MIYWALGLLILGMVFTIAEMFVPGFGFFGVTGIIMLVISWIITITAFKYGALIVILEVIILLAAGFVLFKFIKNRNLNGTIILDESLGEDKKEDYRTFVGREGIAKTPLKPFGKAEFYGNLIDVCGEGYIEPGRRVVAVKFYDGKLYVKPLP